MPLLLGYTKAVKKHIFNYLLWYAECFVLSNCKRQKHQEHIQTHPCSLQTPSLFVEGCWALQCCMNGGEKQRQRDEMWLK